MIGSVLILALAFSAGVSVFIILKKRNGDVKIDFIVGIVAAVVFSGSVLLDVPVAVSGY